VAVNGLELGTAVDGLELGTAVDGLDEGFDVDDEVVEHGGSTRQDEGLMLLLYKLN